jgi:hypothetical protein
VDGDISLGGILRLALAINPGIGERRRSVRRIWPSVSEKNSAYDGLLLGNKELGFVDGMCIGFGRVLAASAF